MRQRYTAMKQRFAVLLGSILFLVIPSLGFAQSVVDLKAEWPKGEYLKKASDPKETRFKITGPGRLDVQIILDPYRSAGRMANIPVVWTRYLPNGKWKGWGVIGEMIDGRTLSSKFFQGGKEAGNFAEGVPLEYKLSIDVSPGEFNLGVRIGPPAAMYGSGWTQWGQKARVIIDFSPSGSPAPPPVKAAIQLAGKNWFCNLDKVHPCLIIQNGDELTFVGEKGNRSKGYFINASTVIATDWEHGLKGQVTDNGNRINWANGTFWTRNSVQAPLNPITGTWKSRHTHEGCTSRQPFCKAYDGDLVFEALPDKSFRGKFLQLTLQGKLEGAVYRFDYYKDGQRLGYGTFTFDAAFKTFTGHFEDINGHRGSWSGTRS